MRAITKLLQSTGHHLDASIFSVKDIRTAIRCLGKDVAKNASMTRFIGVTVILSHCFDMGGTSVIYVCY